MERFDFQENLSAGPPDQLAKYRPLPGEVVLEVYDKDGRMVGMDSFDAGVEAPRCSCYVSCDMVANPFDRENGVAATFTSLRDMHQSALLQWECAVDMPLPFDIPNYMVDKPGAHRMKLWWGSKENDA